MLQYNTIVFVQNKNNAGYDETAIDGERVLDRDIILNSTEHVYELFHTKEFQKAKKIAEKNSQSRILVEIGDYTVLQDIHPDKDEIGRTGIYTACWKKGTNTEDIRKTAKLIGINELSLENNKNSRLKLLALFCLSAAATILFFSLSAKDK